MVKTSKKTTKTSKKSTKSTKKSTKSAAKKPRAASLKPKPAAKIAVKAEPKLELAPVSTGADCLVCRWLKRLKAEKACPATGIKVDLAKPVQNCEKFRKFSGEYYV